jgi:hypothetical protein
MLECEWVRDVGGRLSLCNVLGQEGRDRNRASWQWQVWSQPFGICKIRFL